MCEMMSKESKESLTVLIVTHVTHVERVERLCYVETRDIHIFAHNFLNILTDFQSENSFGKLRLRPFQPYHTNAMYVKGVENYFDFQPL